jgi:hypothetical protein
LKAKTGANSQFALAKANIFLFFPFFVFNFSRNRVSNPRFHHNFHARNPKLRHPFISPSAFHYVPCKKRFLHKQTTGSEIAKCHIQENHTRQPALTAERNVKFHSSQTAPGQFTAASATPNVDHHADSKNSS